MFYYYICCRRKTALSACGKYRRFKYYEYLMDARKDKNMTIDRLAKEYDNQYNILNAKIEGLRPLLYVYTGEDLYLLRRRLKVYYDMASECKRISAMLTHYYDEEENYGLH